MEAEASSQASLRVLQLYWNILELPFSKLAALHFVSEVNYLYRICLQQETVLGLVGVSCHHLEAWIVCCAYEIYELLTG